MQHGARLHLDALDIESGTLGWKYTTGNLIGESSPAVGSDTVYIGDLGGIVHAVSTSDGAQRWTFQTGSEIKSSPVLVNDIVLIGSYDGHLYALDANTGEVLGAHMVGHGVTELISNISAAMQLEATEVELMHTVFPHPTLSEALHESVPEAFGQPIPI